MDRDRPHFPAPPAAARAGLDLLAARHPALARIEREGGPLPWRTRPAGFPGLMQAIMGQQISNAAASAIWRRLAAVPGALEPAGLLALDDPALRAPGLSIAKIAAVRALAAAFLDGRLDADTLAGLPDEDAVARIAAVPGLGRWTAEVFLVFALQRPDVFPAGDLALAAAAANLHALPSRPGPAVLRRLAEDWAPFRSLAARLLWHWWRIKTGRRTMDDG